MAALDDNIQTQLSGKTLQVVSFALGSEEYGVDIAQVQEINRMVAITRVPQAQPFMEGVIKSARAAHCDHRFAHALWHGAC